MWELYLFSLIRASCKSVDVSIPLAGGNTVDFCCKLPSDDITNVECTVINPDTHNSAEFAMLRELFEHAAAYMTVPGWQFGLDSYVRTNKFPSARRLANTLSAWLSELPYGQRCGATREDYTHGMASIIEGKSGWKFTLVPYELVQHNLKPDYLLVSYPCQASWSSKSSDIREQIERKLDQHARLPRLIVAVSVEDWPGEPSFHEVTRALYGDVGVRFARTPQRRTTQSTPEPQSFRAFNGLWRRARPAERLIGVIVSSKNTMHAPNDHMSLWLKPGVSLENVLPGWPFHVVQYSDELGQLVETVGATPSDVLGVPSQFQHGTRRWLLSGES